MSSSPETASFVIELEDETSGPAGDAAGALEQLKARIEAGQKALREMQAAQSRMKGTTASGTESFKRLRDQIAAQKSAVGQAQARYVELGGTFGQTTRATKGFLETARQTPGPLGAMAGKVATLRTMLGTTAGRAMVMASAALVGVGALIALGVAAVAAVAGLVSLTAEMVRFGIAAADARRSEALHLEGLTLIRRHHGLARGTASELVAAIDRVSGVAAVGRSELTGYAESLYRMGLRGENLNQALEGMAISAAVGGEAAGRRFAGMAAGAARTGRSVRALADDVRARLGGVNARMNLSLERQATRLREAFASLFGGPAVASSLERFLERLNELSSLFGESTASGRALRAIVEAIFPMLLDGASEAGPSLRRVFQHMVIAALRATVVVLTLRNAMRRGVGEGSFLDALTGALVLATPLIAGVAVGFAAVRAGLTALGTQLVVGLALWSMFLGAVGRASRFLSELDLGAVADAMIGGLVAGIRRGREAVMGAVRSVATGAESALRDALGIHSPSRVFAELGMHVSHGFGEGVDSGAPSANAAVEDLVDVPTGGGIARGSSTVISIGDVHVHAGETSDARGLAIAFRDELASALEGVGVRMGAPA